MDVKGAFSNTVPRVLVKDMRSRGVSEKVVEWFEEKLKGWRTVIAFDDYELPQIPVNSGLDQGCNMSGLCYNFYNARQIKGVRTWD